MSGKAALKIVVGSILAAYGLTLAVYAGFGGATLAIFWQGVANLTGLTIGGRKEFHRSSRCSFRRHWQACSR